MYVFWDKLYQQEARMNYYERHPPLVPVVKPKVDEAEMKAFEESLRTSEAIILQLRIREKQEKSRSAWCSCLPRYERQARAVIRARGGDPDD
jgi:hypothetical protein